jgi:alpha-glucosidase
LKATGTTTMQSAFPGYPVSFKMEGSPYVQGQVKEHSSYMGKVDGQRSYPWRIFGIAENDAELLSNTLVYQLASPSEIEDVSWIKPGVVTFDWWGRRNIYGVDFKSGINTETAKYFIDFCADFGFEYFLFDDGWSKLDNLLEIHPDLDMKEVMDYASEKEVKVMVWAIWNTFLQQEEEAWELFETWGFSGIKFDFMNRDDQLMVQFFHHVAEEAAKRKMVLDFHGAYKPAGLRRTYPNVLTREALIEFEYNGWTKHDTPTHHNLLPYIRMVAGPMDYIPYTTHNATWKNFRPVGDMPMGQGTRAHSMALFVVLESPLQMLPDSPSDYYKEQECTEFISSIPTEWDNLKVLHAKIGEHTVVARKNGDNWYIGAITDWKAKSFDINLDFLDEANYTIEYIEDGINADTRAIDYMKKSKSVTNTDTIQIDLAPGGGWIAKVIKEK